MHHILNYEMVNRFKKLSKLENLSLNLGLLKKIHTKLYMTHVNIYYRLD